MKIVVPVKMVPDLVEELADRSRRDQTGHNLAAVQARTNLTITPSSKPFCSKKITMGRSPSSRQIWMARTMRSILLPLKGRIS